MEGVTHQTTHQKDKQPLNANTLRGRLPHWDVVPKTGVEPVCMLSPTVFKGVFRRGLRKTRTVSIAS